MKNIYEKILVVIVVIALFCIDALIFHDFFKAGKQYTLAEYLTGIISIPLFYLLGKNLIAEDEN